MSTLGLEALAEVLNEETMCPDSDFLHKSIIVGDFLTNFVQKWQNQSEIKFIFGKPPKTLSLEI